MTTSDVPVDRLRSPRGEQDAPAWRDTARPIADRVEALLAAMTLEERAGQLGSRWVGNGAAAGGGADEAPRGRRAHDAAAGADLNVAPMQDVFAAAGAQPLEESARHGLGHLTRVYGSAPVSAAQGAAELVRQQRAVVSASRLGIPAIVHEECLTGFTSYGATVYPAAIAWGATFDPDLVERMAAAIGRDMAALGIHQGLSPVLDVVRDYRWGRVEETIGEDPYLVAVLGAAYVRGLQSAGVLATLKHFAGYSASRGARNHGPVSMGRRELLDVVLPPFEAAVRLAGAASVMNSYSDVDGVPAGADAWLLTELLRDAWGFEGTVVSDYWAVPFLTRMHRVAADDADAGAQALAAGLDVELPDTIGFAGLVEQVRSGDLPEELVDRAARRVLTQKAELGLLDPDWTPEASVAGAAARRPRLPREPRTGPRARRTVDRAARRRVRPAAARRRPTRAEPRRRRRAVRGRRPHLHGLLLLPQPHARALPGHRPRGRRAHRARRPPRGAARGGRRPRPGCDVRDDDRSGFAEAVDAARGADVVVALVGDLAGLFGRGTSGEGCDAEDLRLPGVQADLLEELLATGTPVVVVVVSGRPYALGSVQGRAAALVQAFMPGEEGGAAIAGVLSGRVQPTGKLPVQIPRARAASRAPTCSRRWGRTTPARAASTPAPCSRSGTAPPTPRSR